MCDKPLLLWCFLFFFLFFFLQRKAFCLSGLYYMREGQAENTRLLSQRVSPWCTETKSSSKRERMLGQHHDLPTAIISTHTVRHWSVRDSEAGGKTRARPFACSNSMWDCLWFQSCLIITSQQKREGPCQNERLTFMASGHSSQTEMSRKMKKHFSAD